MEDFKDYTEFLRRDLCENLVTNTDFDAKISVIVPCYNVEQYIEKCLNSLIKQTLKEIEIICIDDGSIDSTSQIINTYSKLDKRVKIIAQNNKKQGAARNAGMKIASGEYIGFVDSDDWVDLNYYEKLYNTAKKYDSDIALADYIRIGNGRTKKRLNIKTEAVYTTLDEKFGICKQAKQPSPANKIYRTDFLRKYNLIFPEGVYSEDKIFTCKAVYYANSVVSVPDTYYYYFRRPNSTVKTKNKNNEDDKKRANQIVLKFLKDNNVNLEDNDFWAVKKECRFLGCCLYAIKESLKTEKHLLFGVIPLKEAKKMHSIKIKHISDTINVCVSCDDNYSKYAGVVIASILYNADKRDKLNIYILDGGISEIHKKEIMSLKSIKDCKIEFVKIDNNLFEEYSKIKTHSYITLPACYRLKLSSLLPNISRLIYFDCDVIVNSSLSNLFHIDLGKYALAGVRDINRRMIAKDSNYVNSGVLLLDLDKWREEKIEDKLLEFTKANIDNIKKGDQEIINRCLSDYIMTIDDEWNVQSSNFTNRSSYTQNPKVVHFVAERKPWNWASLSYHRDLYFKYLQLTPWKLSDEELKHWTKDNQIASLLSYLKYRPFFFLRPRYYEALLKTYFLPLFEPKKPVIQSNTFIVWEPCSKSHSEVVPGYVKYLLDLGYHVSVLVHPDRLKEGLFARFNGENISYNKMSRKQIIKYFNESDLSDVSGVLVTTVGKLCDEIHFEDAYKIFNENADKSKIFFVAHEAEHALNAGTWNENLITLRELNYKNGKSVVVNPHYFGEVKAFPKNDITNFVMVGAIKSYKKNDNTIISAVEELDKKGITNFKITVIGKGHIKNIPPDLRKYFDMKGRLPFRKMYDELETADFLLTAYDVEKPEHIRYNTTGTSGNFQLVYGFVVPPVIVDDFAPINRFDNSNAILYSKPEDYSSAMERAINMSAEEYKNMQQSLKNTAEKISSESLKHLEDLINA